MGKKNDNIYFESFVKASDCAVRAARMLDEGLRMSNGRYSAMQSEIHAIEHEADMVKHELMDALLRAFITPIERDDIMRLAQNIDDVVDAVDDIAIRLYINNVTVLRPDCLEFTTLLVKCCEKMKMLMVEFADFRKSKTLNSLIIEMNGLEEDGDKAYMNAMRTLHTQSRDALEIIAWREIYDRFENVCDACEHVADVVESAIIENT